MDKKRIEEIKGFIGVLLIGLVYTLKKGTLNWDLKREYKSLQ